MAEKIKIIDKEEEIRRQKEDINTYKSMLEDIVGKLKINGLDCLMIPEGKAKNLYYRLFQIDKGNCAQIFPFFLEEDSLLENIRIEVHNKEAFTPIEITANEYLDRYNHLKKITIETYFKRE